ncbi:site-2 protease family protein [Methanobacterium alkalithermotolerans]|uniref:Zinc metalloprotease n=1 Tax=Methanobacterium alkalithermotolerans TaxID=2731220 RepID=A0A8T8K310_9EURY|nr:site-2 protease family protein [Methanobacterium alkalithermotolerans]QUH22886.1 site-2 protease family protein [Methanobacterium alkalithermotolerans]RJS48785.1 MAG: sporulation protein [Methanobacterium sp.]
MKTSIRILKVFGIPIELDISFLLLIIFIYVLAFFNIIPLQLAILITLVFATVVIHELSHSYVAQKYGVEIKKIVLLPIGGVAQMSEVPKKPRQELFISLAGPLTNVIIAIILYLTYQFTLTLLPGFISNFILEFMLVNVVLAVFNLIPAFPMDGGRVLRAILAERMDYLRATEISVSIGKIFAVIMAVAGIFVNFFLILIALFIYIGADQEYKSTIVSSLLKGMLVENIMTTEVKTLDPHITIEEALNKIFEYKHMGYPVIEDQKLVGIVTFQDLSQSKYNKNSMIREVMTEDIITVSPHEEVISALEKLNKNNLGRLPVVEENRLTGIVSKTDILKVLNLMRNKVQ